MTDSEPVSVSRSFKDLFFIDDNHFKENRHITHNFFVGSEENFEQMIQLGSVWVVVEWLNYEEDIKMSYQ